MSSQLFNSVYNYINNDKTEDAIELLYENINKINNVITNYINLVKIESKKIIRIDRVPTDKDYNKIKNIDDTEYNICKTYRIVIWKLMEKYLNQKLLEKNEFKSPRTNITFVITIGDTILKRKLFILYILSYNLESNLLKYITKYPYNYGHLGLDFEFNNRIIALMQLCFNTYSSLKNTTYSYIWIINPTDFNEQDIRFFIDKIMINTNIYKILHGADSLDIPYLYTVFFNNNKDLIIRFTKKVIDTRFLCEYFRSSLGEEKKCSIYDALLYFGSITEEKHKELNDTHDYMGPVQDISWNINKLSSHHARYALFDVLFLKRFLYDIFIKIKTETPKYIETYKYIIPLTRFIFIERREITKLVEEAKTEIDPINNYLIHKGNQNITLITIYNTLVENFKIPVPEIDITFLLSVNYFKRTLLIIFKKIVYSIILNNFKVYMNKKDKYNGIISLNSMYSELNKLGFKKLTILFELFYQEAIKRIIKEYKL